MKCMDITTDRTASQNTIATAGTTATDTVIAVNGLRRTYGTGSKSFEAVAGISFEVRRGEVFGLLGTNGAGKTSSLDVIEGLAEPTDGTVEVLGFDPFRERAKVRPDMGIMLQSGGLPSQLTVFETMRMWHGTCSAPLPCSGHLRPICGHLRSLSGRYVAAQRAGPWEPLERLTRGHKVAAR